MRCLSQLLFATLSIASIAQSWHVKPKQNRHQIWRIFIKSTVPSKDYANLPTILQNALVEKNRPILVERNWTEVVVSMEETVNVSQILKDNQIKWIVTETDVERLLASQRLEKPSDERRRRRRTDDNSVFFSDHYYHPFESMETYFQALSNRYPDLVQLLTIGRTHEKRNIYVLKLGKANGTKPAVWVDGGLHAREWAASHSVIYYIKRLVNDYLMGANTERLTELGWYIAPMLNPDGYSFTFKNAHDASDRLWRKNRSAKNCRKREHLKDAYDQRRCCTGVDLNRNFDFHWASGGLTSSDPCSGNYHGPRAFSEPETKAVRDFLIVRNRLAHNIKAAIDVHCYAQMWMHPFGYAKDTYPEDTEQVRALAESAVRKVAEVYGVEYTVGTPADTWYVAPGIAMDWLKEKGVKYSYTVELRPRYDGLSGFLMDMWQVRRAARETFSGIAAVGDRVIQEFS